MWLSSHSNRAARNNSLTTGLSQHDVLFARKPRQVVTDVARSRSGKVNKVINDIL